MLSAPVATLRPGSLPVVEGDATVAWPDPTVT